MLFHVNHPLGYRQQQISDLLQKLAFGYTIGLALPNNVIAMYMLTCQNSEALNLLRSGRRRFVFEESMALDGPSLF